ncbi:MAG TPA: hypothetical protein V6C63_02840 [Allocoleopsis sp.]
MLKSLSLPIALAVYSFSLFSLLVAATSAFSTQAGLTDTPKLSRLQ